MPAIVIPAQAGIQGLGFQALIGKGCDATVWIPACAGMTIQGVLIWIGYKTATLPIHDK